MVDLGEPTMFLIICEDKNWPTLFKIGEVDSFIIWGDIFSNSLVQKFFKTGSVNFSTTPFLNFWLVNISGTISKVESGISSRVKIVFLRIYSSLGPQELAYSLKKMETIPEDTNSFWEEFVTSKGFK